MEGRGGHILHSSLHEKRFTGTFSLWGFLRRTTSLSISSQSLASRPYLSQEQYSTVKCKINEPSKNNQQISQDTESESCLLRTNVSCVSIISCFAASHPAQQPQSRQLLPQRDIGNDGQAIYTFDSKADMDKPSIPPE